MFVEGLIWLPQTVDWVGSYGAIVALAEFVVGGGHIDPGDEGGDRADGGGHDAPLASGAGHVKTDVRADMPDLVNDHPVDHSRQNRLLKGVVG